MIVSVFVHLVSVFSFPLFAFLHLFLSLFCARDSFLLFQLLKRRVRSELVLVLVILAMLPLLSSKSISGKSHPLKRNSMYGEEWKDRSKQEGETFSCCFCSHSVLLLCVCQSLCFISLFSLSLFSVFCVFQAQADRAARKAKREEIQATLASGSLEDPEDVQALHFAEKNMGDYKLKSDPNYIVPEQLVG